MSKINTKRWTEEDIKNALAEIENGLTSIRATAIKHGVNEATLRLRIRNKRDNKQFVGSGRKPTLNHQTENDLAEVIRVLCCLGFSPTRDQVKNLVKEYVEEKKMKTPFTDNCPGKEWLRLFMDRNNLSLKKATMISSACKAVTANPFVVNDFYDTLEKVIKEKNFTPSQIWNCDESGFPTDPKRCKVVSGSGEIAYRVTPGAGRENTTTLAAVNAAGRALPPLVIFPGKIHQESWFSPDRMPGTLYGCSENGWMTTDVFFEWFKHFCRVITDRPLLLLFDGHLSHVSAQLIIKAMEEDVTIIKFPPHVTDLLQPLDVACFGPLKREWERILNEWCITYGGKRPLRKADFIEKLTQCWKTALSEDNMKAGFRRTGIFPIDRTKYPEKRFDPRLLKRYAKWCEMGKPDNMMEELARAPNTPQKIQQHFEESASSSKVDESIESHKTPSASSTQTPSTSKQLSSTPTHNHCCEISKKIGPKPMPYPGKVWVPGWVLQDPPSTFEEKILTTIKGPLVKPKPIRRKVDWKTKVMSTENYLEKLSEGKEKAKPSKKRQKMNKEEEDKEDQMVESETEEEIIEEESSEEEEKEEKEEKITQLWKWLSPPTREDEIKGKWFAVVFKPESKMPKKRSLPSLYIGKATTRFLEDEDGPACGIEFDCLKPHVGSGNILESYTGASRDISLFRIYDVIAGPLEVNPEKGNKWNVPHYQKIQKLFNFVKNLDRSQLYSIEC